MAQRTACAIAAFAIGFAFADEARGEETRPAEEPASDQAASLAAHAERAPDPAVEKLRYARSAAYGTTIAGFVVAGLGGFTTVALATFGSDLLWIGAFVSPIMFAAGPSAGHYRLGHTAYATGTMLGTYLLGVSGLSLIAYGVEMSHQIMAQDSGDGDALIVGGAILGLASVVLAIIDLVALEPSVWNRWFPSAAARDEEPFEVSPTAWASPNSAGLAAVGAF